MDPTSAVNADILSRLHQLQEAQQGVEQLTESPVLGAFGDTRDYVVRRWVKASPRRLPRCAGLARFAVPIEPRCSFQRSLSFRTVVARQDTDSQHISYYVTTRLLRELQDVCEADASEADFLHWALLTLRTEISDMQTEKDDSKLLQTVARDEDAVCLSIAYSASREMWLTDIGLRPSSVTSASREQRPALEQVSVGA
jgi:hypothetical protein